MGIHRIRIKLQVQKWIEWEHNVFIDAHTHKDIELHLFDGKKNKWGRLVRVLLLRQDAVLCECVILAQSLGRRADGAVPHHGDGDGGGEEEEEGCCWGVDRREHKQQPIIWIWLHNWNTILTTTTISEQITSFLND